MIRRNPIAAQTRGNKRFRRSLEKYYQAANFRLEGFEPRIMLTVSDLAASVVSSSRVDLSWRDQDSNESAFVIEQSQDGGSSWQSLGETYPNQTSYSLTGLQAASDYDYRVRARYADNSYSAYSNSVAVTTLGFAAPAGLSAKVVSGERVDLSWQDRTLDESYFDIERSTDGGTTWQLYTQVYPNQTSYSITGLDPGATYNFRVRGEQSGGNFSDYTNSIAVTTTPFAAPSELTATAISGSQIDLSWHDNTDNEAAFVIERSLDGGTTWQAYSEVYPSQTSYRMENLDPGTTYNFRVRARHANGSYSGFSELATSTTFPFSGPTDLAATVVSGSQIDLAWKDHSDNEDSFYIEQSDDGGTSWQSLGSVYANQTSYQVTGLEPGTSYGFRVRAHHPNLTFSDYTNIVTASTANFAAPSSLTYDIVSGERVDLAWQDNSDNESAFIVERSDDAGASWLPYAELYPNQTSFQMTGLTPGASYLFRVRGKHGNGSYSAYTNTVSATTNVVGAPTNLSATAISGSRVDLAWQDHSDNEDGFYIERSDDGGSTWQTPIVIYPNQTSYQVTGLTSGNTYSFRVRARHSSGVYSAYANTATIEAQGLGAPTDLNLSSVSATEINLFWRDNSPAESGFKVERKANDEQNFTEIAQLPANSTGYSATGLDPAKTYSFRVRSYDASQNSAYSNIATLATSPVTAPSALTATVVSGSSINLQWSDNSDNENAFYIERSLNGGGTWEAYTSVSADQTNYLVTGLDPGTTYQFRVRGGHSNGTYSTYSNTVSATTTLFAAPSLLTATAVSGTGIKLNWVDNSDNEASFLIEESSDAGVTWEPYTTVSADQTNYLVTGLQPGISYQFKVSAHHSNGSYSSSSNVVSATTTAFSGAAELKATVMSGSRIDLAWTDLADGESAFWLEESVDGGANWTLYTNVGADETSYSVTGLDPGATYSFRVRAQHSGGTYSPYSNVATAQTVPFAAPSALSATVVSGSRVDLAWRDLSDNESSFWIEESTDSGATWTALTSVMANQTSYSVTGLDPGQDYSFRVRGQLSNGSYSAYSAPVSVLTTTFAAPTQLTAQVLSSHEINLQWQDQSDNESAFWIEWSVNGGGTWSALTNTSANQTSYLVTSLDPGVTYSFRVHGQLSSGAYSGYSNTVVAKTVTFAGPSNLQAVRISDTEIDLSWQDNTDDEAAFYIERSSDGGGTWEVYTNLSANQTSYAATGLPSGVNYDFRVRAQYANGTFSPYATTTTAAPQLNAPSNLSATPSGWLTRLTWRDNSGNETGFKVERRLGTNGPWAEIASVGAGVTQFLDSVSGGSYSYRVRAFFGTYLFSPYSNASTIVSVGTPEPYVVPGTPGTTTRVHVHFEKEKIEALYKNELGLFIVDGTNAAVNGLLPGDPGYAIAALTDPTRRVVFNPAADEGATYDIDLIAGTYLSYYLVQDDTTESFIRNNPSNSMSGHPHVFFPNIDANKDGRYAHFVRTDLEDGGVRYNVEDLDYGGDKDFDDMVFMIDATPDASTATIDLSIDQIPDDVEESVGGYILLNEDHQELNSDGAGGPLEDNQPDNSAGDHIVANDPDLRNASLNLDGTEGRWTLTFPSKIMVWREISPGTYSQVGSGQQSEIVSGAQAITLKIEGISVSGSVGDAQISATFTPTSGPIASDLVKLSVLAVDAHVDSDNNNGLGLPDESPDESLAENNFSAGKTVIVNNGDGDKDGIADYLDGFNRDGIANNPDDISSAAHFTPFVLDMETPFDPTNATISFTYSASDPSLATSAATAKGKLRIWTKDGDQSRTLGDFVKPNFTYSGSALGLSATVTSRTFWIEGIRETDLDSDRLIHVEVDPDGTGALPAGAHDNIYVNTEKENPTTGAITGNVFHDRNRNALWDDKFIQGAKPDVIFVLDHSDSTYQNKFQGSPVGDLNDDGVADSILDGEIAAFIALNRQLMEPEYADRVRIGILTFDNTTTRIHFTSEDGTDLLAVKPNADIDRNGIPDVEDALRQVQDGGGTFYINALNETKNVFEDLDPPTMPGSANVIFMSDGEPLDPVADLQGEIKKAAQELQKAGANVRAFGVGSDVPLEPLTWIDNRAAVFTTTDELLGAFGGVVGDELPEEGLQGWTAYIDADSDGQLDPNELSTVSTADGQYALEDLAPGDYTVKIQMPAGWLQEAPISGNYVATVVAGEISGNNDFGVVENGPEPTIAPLILSANPKERSPVTVQVPAPTGYGPFQYSFDFNGDGDFDDPEDVFRSISPSASFIPDDNGTRVVNVRVHDSVGQFIDYAPVAINVANVAPTVAIGGELPSQIDLSEGNVQLSLSGIVNEPSQADSAEPFALQWTVTRDGTVVQQETSQNLSLLFDATSAATPGTYVIEFAATDKDGGRGVVQRTITVGSSLPRIIAGPTATQGSTIAGTIADLSVTADDDGGVANLHYTWSSTGPAPVSFAPAGDASQTRAIFSEAGVYAITVAIEDADGNVTTSPAYQVTIQPVFSGISPAVSSVASGSAESVVFHVLDQFGEMYTPSETVSWQLLGTPTFGTLAPDSASGTATYTPGATPGQDTVQATVGSTSSTASVAVTGSSDTAIIGKAADELPAVEGISTGDVEVAAFLDLDPLLDPSAVNADQYQATVVWEPGQSAVPAQIVFSSVDGFNFYDVLASHTYASTGTFDIEVTITHTSSQRSVTLDGTVTVAPSELSARFVPFAPVLNTPYSGTIGKFQDAGLAGSPGSFSANVNWGDQTAESAATITWDAVGEEYVITGSHTYALSGPKNIAITISKNGDERGVLNGSTAVSSQTVPVPEYSVDSAAISASQIYLDWEKDLQADGYIIWQYGPGGRQRVPADSSQIIVPTQSDDHPSRFYRVVENLRAATAYSFTIQAIYPDGSESEESAMKTITTWDTVRVPTPTGVEANHVVADDWTTGHPGEGIQLFWDPSDVYGYKVEWHQRPTVPDSDPWADDDWQLLTPVDNYIDPTPTAGNSKIGWFHTITLSPDTQYQYRITAVIQTNDPQNPIAQSPGKTVIVQRDTTGPSQPQNLAVSSFPQAMQLTWHDRPDSDSDWAGWFVQRSPDGVTGWRTLNVSPISDEQGYNDYTAPVAQMSWYRIYAVDRLGNASAYSDVISHRRSISAEPPAPTGLAGNADGAAAVFLDWDDVTTIRHLGHTDDDLAGYNVYRKLIGDSNWPAAPINSALIISSQYHDATGLVTGSVYEYRVTAVDKDGDESVPSAVASATTGDGLAPAAPQSLAATVESPTFITLSWSLGTGGTAATKFLVYRSRQEDRGFQLVATINAPSTTFADHNLASNTDYYYRVYAVDADGDISAPSAVQSAHTQNVADQRPYLKITNVDAAEAPRLLQADLQVRGIVDDPNNDLEQWQLVLRPIGSTTSTNEIMVAEGGEGEERGQQPSTDAVLGTVQATLLQNGLYELVLKAKDAVGWQELGGRFIQIKTDVKLGNFTLPVTDLQINVPGADPIVVRRVYDSSRIAEPGDFGPGWHLELSNTNLRTTAREGNYGSASKPALRNGDLVYINIPGQGEQAFQFVPTPTNFDRTNPGQGLVLGVVTYYVQFVAVDGSNTKLSVQGDKNAPNPILLRRNGEEFYDPGSNLGYNPARTEFGGQYTLTTDDGKEYVIDASTGAIVSSTDASGIQTTYADGQPTVVRKGIHIERYGDGRIAWIAAIPDTQQPDVLGPKVFYKYDETTGDLISFTNEVGDTTSYSYDPDHDHYLASVTDGRGVDVTNVTYDSTTGRVETVQDAAGSTAPLGYGGFDGKTGSANVTDPHGNTTEQLFDSHGNVIRQIQAIYDGAQLTKYVVTVHEYNYLTVDQTSDYYDVLQTGRSSQNQLVSKDDYLPFEVAPDDDEGLRYTQTPGSSTLSREITYYHADPSNPQLEVAGLGLAATETVFTADGTPRTTTFLNYKFGKPQQIIDADGNSSWMLYNDQGRLQFSINALGEGFEYEYVTPGGQLVSTTTYQVEDDDGNPDTPPVRISGQFVTREDYDSSTGQLLSSTDASGVITRYTYWPDGNVKQVTKQSPETPVTVGEITESSSEYDAKGRVTLVRDADGNVTRTFYDRAGNLSVSVDKFGGRTVYSYDSRNHLVRTLNPDHTETRSVYDDLGRLQWTTERFVSTSSYTIDRIGNISWTSQDNTGTGVVTRTIYDAVGRVSEVRRYKDARVVLTADPAADGVFGSSLPSGSDSWVQISSTSSAYDVLGRTVETTDQSGLQIGNIYYPNGQLHYSGEIVSGLPSERHILFDGNSDRYLVQYFTYDYDQLDGTGRYDAVTDARGNITKRYKDALGRKIRVSYPDGSFTETLYGTKSQPVAGIDLPTAAEGWTGVPEGGRHVVEIGQRKADEPQIATHYIYDRAGRLTDVWQPAVDDAETSNLVRPHWHYEYDSNGNETMQRDPKGHETTFAYDAHNRRISRTLPDLAQETWKYDTFGRLSVHTDFKGQSTRYLYEIDPQFGGRLTGEERFTGLPDGTPDERTDYSYDNLGRQKTVTEYAQLDSDPDLDISRAATTYQYDPITGGVAQASSPEGTINHTYDAATGLLTRTYTDNNDTSYLYDVRGRLWQMHVTKLNGQSVSQTTTYTYDAVGNLDRVSNDNGTPTDTSDDLVHDYDYDALNRLDLLTVSRGADTIFTQDYELQSDGQRDYVVEHRYTSPTQFSETKIDWSYDALGRLIGERRDEGNDSPTSPNGDHDYLMTFAYDLAGNRKTEEIDKMGTANETVIYTYDEGDHLLNENSTVDANDAEYHYDRNGSMIDKTAASTTTTYGWDLRNRMTSATTADASTIYDYDERGQRVSQQTGTNPTTYYLNDWQNLNGHPQVLEEKQGTSAATAMLSRSYVVGIRVEGEADATNARQFILDGHGSNRGLIDSDGNVLERYDYQAFGNVARFESIDPATGTVTEIGANQATTIHLFGGDSEYDAASKFSYHDTRWRDDFHFISLDTFEGDPSSPIQLHKYLYGNANPVYYTDPTGYFSFGSLLSTIGMIARVGTGIGFGVSGAWNLANAGINLQKAYAASTSGSPSASLEIIGRMVLTIVQTYTGIFNIRLANALLFGAPSPVPLPPNGLGLLRVAVAGGGESPMAVGALVYALSPAIAVGIVNAAGVFLAANTFFSTSFGSGGSSNLPDHLLGNNPKPAPGQPTNTDLPGGEVAARKLFDDLADGPTETTPDGILRSLKNKVQLRLAKDGRWRVDIPANGSKPPETIHFNP